uniref:Uncharacterized protein n=1 Tax=Glossina pallidipes TaxID=7398 RepID=A0A1A9ZHQ3_GLOPL
MSAQITLESLLNSQILMTIMLILLEMATIHNLILVTPITKLKNEEERNMMLLFWTQMDVIYKIFIALVAGQCNDERYKMSLEIKNIFALIKCKNLFTVRVSCFFLLCLIEYAHLTFGANSRGCPKEGYWFKLVLDLLTICKRLLLSITFNIGKVCSRNNSNRLRNDETVSSIRPRPNCNFEQSNSTIGGRCLY